ncbi:immunoglobulin domain-containing protein, partial [Paenibacillus mendelii]
MYKRNFLSGWSAALSFIVMWSALLTGFGAVKAFAADEDAAAPVIVTQPQDQTANEGATATLSVTANASGSGTLTYQWYRNGSNSTSGATQIMNATGASYTVPNVAAGDLYYYVVVTNADTTATGNQTATTTSSVAKVTGNALTHAAVPVIVTQPQDQTVNEGATATLSVNISGEALTFQWYR